MQNPFTDRNLHTNDFKCLGPSFGSLNVCIDFPIRLVPKIHSIFYIKTNTNGCLHNEFFSSFGSIIMSTVVSGLNDIHDYMG